MLVLKFGGTSVANADCIMQAARLIAQQSRPVVAVSSAMSGVTDVLIEAGNLACKRNYDEVEKRQMDLRRRHDEAARVICPDSGARKALSNDLDALFSELTGMLNGISLLQELSPRSLDLISSFGERLLVPLLAEALVQQGVPAKTVDARSLLRTNSTFGAASVDHDVSREQTRDLLLPLCKQTVPVVTGYIASDASGNTTTLGRGGSDYSATVIGSYLQADEIWIFTDVDGMMTADPRVVPEARVLDEITYREAAESAYFGSKVLHPSTMIPAVRAKIPIRIRNTFNPEHQGTLISTRRVDRFEGVKTVTSISDLAMVTVEGKGMLGVPGMVKRVFTATAAAGINVFMISQASSEQNISFIVRGVKGELAVAALEKEFELESSQGRIDTIGLRAPVGILAIIGEGMQGTPGISRRLFAALGRARINVLSIAQGSSELNVSVVVEQRDLHRAVGAVHTRFGLTRDTHLFLFGKGLIGRTLIQQVLQSRRRLGEHGLSLKVLGVCGRNEWLFEPLGLDDSRLQGVAKGEDITKLGGEARPTDKEILKQLAKARRLDIVVVDVSADDTGELHHQALAHGFHVVTANKKPMSGPLASYDAIRKEALHQGCGYHFETTFGAGLPVLFTLQDLLATRDRVLRVTGCFSGTLGYICSELSKNRPFSEIVTEAKKLGYTEPDPRDDLCGMDVARKALIIAREIGSMLEMNDIALEGLVPQELLELQTVDEFMARLSELDDGMAKRVEQAAKEGKVLRFVAEITPENVQVGLQAVPLESPLGQLSGPDNIVIYQTERYYDYPLIIRGPGAGAEVTAAGVLGDILKVARTS